MLKLIATHLGDRILAIAKYRELCPPIIDKEAVRFRFTIDALHAWLNDVKRQHGALLPCLRHGRRHQDRDVASPNF